MKRELSRVALVLVLLMNVLASRTHAAQTPKGSLTKAEETEARAVAAGFADRLFETHDFGAVVREFYVEDYMPRYLRSQYEARRGSDSSFMLEGVPSLSFNRRLAARAEDENWPRLFVAAGNMIHYGFARLLSLKSLEELSDPEKLKEEEMFGAYPPEAVKILDANPALANFLKKKGAPVEVKTPEELRAAAEGMEEAARLTRASLGKRVRESATLKRNIAMLKTASERMGVSLIDDAEAFGYPKGTRRFKVFAVSYDLILVKEDGRLKVIRATVPED
jgi:hypothetical protein